MSKKDFVAFADTIRRRQHLGIDPFSDSQIVFLADFCETQNPRFNRERWFGYISGACGPSGGKLK